MNIRNLGRYAQHSRESPATSEDEHSEGSGEGEQDFDPSIVHPSNMDESGIENAFEQAEHEDQTDESILSIPQSIGDANNPIMTESDAELRGVHATEDVEVRQHLQEPYYQIYQGSQPSQSMNSSSRVSPKWGCCLEEYLVSRVPEKFRLSKSAVCGIGLACVLSKDLQLSVVEEKHLAQHLISLSEVRSYTTASSPTMSLISMPTLAAATKGFTDIRVWALRVAISRYVTEQSTLSKKAVSQGRDFLTSAESKLKRATELELKLAKDRESFRKSMKESVEIAKERIKGQVLALTQEHLGSILEKMKKLEKKTDTMGKEFNSQLVSRTQPLRDALKQAKEKQFDLEDQLRKKTEDNMGLRAELKDLKKLLKTKKAEKVETGIDTASQSAILSEISAKKQTFESKGIQCLLEDSDKWAFHTLWSGSLSRKEVEPLSHLLMFRLSSADYKVSPSLYSQTCKAFQSMPSLSHELANSGLLLTILAKVSQNNPPLESGQPLPPGYMLTLRLLLDTCFPHPPSKSSALPSQKPPKPDLKSPLHHPETVESLLILIQAVLTTKEVSLLEQSLILLEKASAFVHYHPELEKRLVQTAHRVQDFVDLPEHKTTGAKNLQFIRANLKVVWLNLAGREHNPRCE